MDEVEAKKMHVEEHIYNEMINTHNTLITRFLNLLYS